MNTPLLCLIVTILHLRSASVLHHLSVKSAHHLSLISPLHLLTVYLIAMFSQIPLSFSVSILLLQCLLCFTSIIFLTYPTTLKFHLLLVLPFYLCSHTLPHPLSPTFLLPIFALSFSFHPYSLVSSLYYTLHTLLNFYQQHIRTTVTFKEISLGKIHGVPTSPLMNHISILEFSVSGIPSVNMMYYFLKGSMMQFADCSKTGSRGSLLWSLCCRTWAHLVRMFSVSRSQDTNNGCGCFVGP